jgi:hypothetical protein
LDIEVKPKPRKGNSTADQWDINSWELPYHTTVQPLREEMRTTRQQLQDVLLNPNGLDTTTLQSVQQHLASLQADLLQVHVTLAQTLRGVLTPAQLTQATQLTQQLRALRVERDQLLTPQAQP